MKKYFIATSLALLASQALAMPPKPDKCPSVDALQNSKFEVAGVDYDGNWVAALRQSNFDTQEAWSLVMLNLEANNEQEALVNATNQLSTLAYNQGPIASPEFESWYCIYNDAKGEKAITVTPTLNFPIGIKKLMK